MHRSLIFFFLLALGLLTSNADGQTCPKVAYTTQTATLKSLVATVNCLAGAEKSKAAHGEFNRTGLQVESFQIVGPQHTRAYKKVVLAILSVPAGNEIHTALVSSESPQATVSATAGAECKVKLNPDNTVDGLCNLTGGTLYVVFQN
ncbi:MAG TPA: hypothetical protein VLW84_14175 [Terriglobales bacterium]|nr:hypothetical protein [Terriglobales bacterium]